jgi:hypothetical protein
VESVKSFVEEKEKESGLPARRWLKRADAWCCFFYWLLSLLRNKNQ